MIPLAPILSIARTVPVWAWALAAVLAWGGLQRHQAKTQERAAAVANERAAVEKATAAAEAQARQTEQQWAANARSAADAYNANLARARAGADAARSELDRLRTAVAGTASPASGSASSPGAACSPDGTAAYRAVIGECAGAVQALAAALDSERARLRGLQDYVSGVVQGTAKPK